MNLQRLFETELEKIVATLGTRYQPDKIILYGSFAHGNITENSDIDILIIKNTNIPFGRRIEEVYKLLLDINYKIALELLVFTPFELKERISLGDPFLSEVVNKGKIVYEGNQNDG